MLLIKKNYKIFKKEQSIERKKTSHPQHIGVVVYSPLSSGFRITFFLKKIVLCF